MKETNNISYSKWMHILFMPHLLFDFLFQTDVIIISVQPKFELYRIVFSNKGKTCLPKRVL